MYKFFFKSSAYIFSTVILMTCLSLSSARAAFSDVESSNVFEKYISDIYDRNIVDGFPDGTYRPDAFVTRGEFAKFIVRAFGITSDSTENPFTDINEENTFYSEILALKNTGIISGFSDKTYRPQNLLTRAEAAKFITGAVRYNHSDKFTNIPNKVLFPDVKQGYTFFDPINRISSVKTLSEEKIVNGYSDGYFGTEKNLTRGALAKFISLTLDYVENGGLDIYTTGSSDSDVIQDNTSDISFSDAHNPLLLQNENVKSLAMYQVNGDTLQVLLEENSENRTSHAQIWSRYLRIAPISVRKYISKFNVFTDGKDGMLGAVYRDSENVDKFVFAIDVNDIVRTSGIYNSLIDYVSIHEMGHLVSLNTSQLKVDMDILTASDIEEYKSTQSLKRTFCETFFSQDGCSTEDSYINSFYDQFWIEKYDEIKAILELEDGAQRNTLLEMFYTKYSKDFISAYAATGVEEDFAESFTNFIFKQKPEDTSIESNKKILFFYDYPEIVSLRDQVRSNFRELYL